VEKRWLKAPERADKVWLKRLLKVSSKLYRKKNVIRSLLCDYIIDEIIVFKGIQLVREMINQEKPIKKKAYA